MDDLEGKYQAIKQTVYTPKKDLQCISAELREIGKHKKADALDEIIERLDVWERLK